MKKLLAIIAIILAACQPARSTSTLLPQTILTSTDTSTSQLPVAEAATSISTIPPSTIELEGTEVPQGFSLIKFADLPQPTAFAFDGQGKMYVTSNDGNVYILRDDNADGRSDSQTVYASGFTIPLGVTVHLSSGDVYISDRGRITILRDTNGDDQADMMKTFVSDLPFQKHQNDNLKFGPDEWLYIGVGSTCDACDDPDPRSASIMRFNIETGESQIYATGLRNPFDIAFQPTTGELFATDNGRDDLGMDAPFEELNHIIQGGDYGYPNCWDEQNVPGCENTIPAVAFFEPHSSADSLDFYKGEKFPAEYRGNVFISIFGSWLKQNVQTGIQRVVLTQNGNSYQGKASWFIRFPARSTTSEGVMPLPLLFGPDEALYVGDYVNNAVYRISYGLP